MDLVLWLVGAVMCAAMYLPAMGARTDAGRRALRIVGTIAALAVGSLAVAGAINPGGPIFPSDALFYLLLLGLPLAAGMATAGLVLLATKSSNVSDEVRTGFAVAALVVVLGFGVWLLFTQ